MSSPQTLVKLFVVAAFAGTASPAAAATPIDYFLPTPIYDQLESNAWGAAGVVCNRSRLTSRR